MLDEPRREIVEQLRMRRLVALRAEIAWRGNERAPEVPAPCAVHDDARGKAWRIAEDSLGEFQTTGPLLESRITLGEHCRKSARHDLARRRVVARLEHGHVARLAGLIHKMGVRRIGCVDVLRRLEHGVHVRLGRALLDRGPAQARAVERRPQQRAQAYRAAGLPVSARCRQVHRSRRGAAAGGGPPPRRGGFQNLSRLCNS